MRPSDIHLHDTYYVIGHFHYVVAPGTIFAMFAGIYYWFPKATGRQDERAARQVHFWGSLIAINGVFFPMFIQGLAGVSRRLYDGGAQYAHAKPVLHTNVFIVHLGVPASRLAADAVHHQLLLEHPQRQARRRIRGMPRRWTGRRRRRRRSAHGNFAVAAAGLPRTVRVQRARTRDGDFFPQHVPDAAPAPSTGGGMLNAPPSRRRRADAKMDVHMDGHALTPTVTPHGDAHAAHHEIEIPYTDSRRAPTRVSTTASSGSGSFWLPR